MQKKSLSGILATILLLTSGTLLPTWGQTGSASGDTPEIADTRKEQTPLEQTEMLEILGMSPEKRLQNIFSASSLADKSKNTIGENIVKNSSNDRNRRRRSQRSLRGYKLSATLALIGGTLSILTFLLTKNNRVNCNSYNSYSTNCY